MKPTISVVWMCCCGAIGYAAEPASFTFPRSTPEAQGIASSAILEFVDTADREIADMHSFMLVRHGHVVAEGWWTPYDAATRHALYSLSKSFTSTAAGIAIADGKFSLDDPVLTFFPEDAPAEPSENLRALQVRHLLSMSTGQETEPRLSSADQPWTKTFLEHAFTRQPGTHFMYNTAATYMVSAIVQKQTGEKVLDYLRPRLFEPLGIEDPTWGTSPQGITLGGYGLSVRTEDIARLGQLYLRKGVWNGKQLLPASWVEAATSPQIANGSDPESDWNQGYGFQFWRCRYGCYRGDGAFGQYCIVMPDQDAVVAITSGVKDMQAVLNLVWKKLLPAMRRDPLPDAADANAELQRKLATLVVPVQDGAASSSLAKTVSGNQYVFEANDRKIEMMGIACSEDGGETTLVVRSDGTEQRAVCGRERWVKGRLAIGRFPEQAVAICGAWTADDTFTTKICFYETPHCLTLRLKFAGELLILDSEMNVDFGPTGQPQLTGRLTPSVNYGRPFEPPTRPAFIPLPPGTIEPTGWLRDWAWTARDGYTGHMDEFDVAFRQAWAADYRMTGDQLTYWDRGAWPYEGGGYWLDGMIRLGYCLHDDFLLNKAKARLDVVVNNMNENGILFMWWLNKNNPADAEAAGKQAGGEAQAWPVWANGLMGRALAAYYAGSGDARVLRALEMAYRGDHDWIRKGWSLSNPWPAFETYTWTGNATIREALTELFANNGIETPDKKVRLYDSWYNRMPDEKIPWYKQPDHGVHFNEGTIPWALGYLWTGQREYLEAPCRWYEILERGDDGMQPHGVPVCDENAGPTGSLRGTETCNVAGYMWSQITLLRVGGQGLMGDRVERAFFNAAPAVVSRDFKTHVYHQAPNRIARNLPDGSPFLYETTHWPLCCSAALNRFLPNYVMHMWMATYDNGLSATHYGPCKVSALVGDRVPVELECRTDYPFNDFIDLDVRPARDATFPLSFRIPGWCANPEITLNGSLYEAAADANGFVRIERLWKPGDSIHLRFPMTVRVNMGHDNGADDTPYATVSYGPLLFALAIPDTLDANTVDNTFKWNYALDVQGEQPGFDITVERQPMPDQWGWQLDAPLKLLVRARRFDWEPVARQAFSAAATERDEASPFHPETILTHLPAQPVSGRAASEEIRLIPYGCTKFRISMFPITQRTFNVLTLNTMAEPEDK
jgi:CubicO group peptidase (beta-lactamase class C family)